MSRRAILRLWLTIWIPQIAHAWISNSFPSATPWPRHAPTTTQRSYRNHPGHDNHDDASTHAHLAIPILGPIPGMNPLIVGEEWTLQSPTLGQWQTLEEAVFLHQQQAEGTACVEAAPLLALLHPTLSPSPSRSGLRYATLVAVLGVTTTSPRNENHDSMRNTQEWMDWIRQPHQTSVLDHSTVRLKSVGRALLGNLVYRIPSHTLAETMDEEGHLILPNDLVLSEEDDHDEDEEEELSPNSSQHPFQSSSQNPKIIMAQDLHLLQDRVERSAKFAQQHQQRSPAVSPVHALSQMANLANQMHRLHQDRQKLVQTIQASTVRLQQVSGALEDYDGLGMLFSGNDEDREESPTSNTKETSPIDDATPWQDMIASIENAVIAQHTRLIHLENYGLGYMAATLASMADLTRQNIAELQPYYSPIRNESEEHYFEIHSFVALQSLSKYLEPAQIDWALHCTNTVERMEQLNEWMWEHYFLLKEEMSKVLQDLSDCGDECTKLF